MNGKIRRVVTAQSFGQKGRVASDGIVPNVHRFGDHGPVVIDVWKTFATPSLLDHGDEEPAAGPMSLLPPKGGHVFRIAEIPPEYSAASGAASAAELFEKMGAAEAATHRDSDETNGGLMHRTESLDYGIVLEGQITLVLDEGEVSLNAGDVVIQRGSNHAWSNRSGKVCRMAFFMTDAVYPSD